MGIINIYIKKQKTGMKRFKEFLNESKQVGTLYHFTSVKGLQSILSNNVLGVFSRPVSLTRDKNLHKSRTADSLKGVRFSLEIDGDKLSNRHKIVPYKDTIWLKRGAETESEERVKPPINNIGDYIKSISIHNKHGEDYDSISDEEEKVIRNVKAKGIKFKYNKYLNRVDKIDEEFEKREYSGYSGSSSGGVYREKETGEEFFIKHPYNSEQAKTEILSSKIHSLLGLRTLNPELKSGIVSNRISISTRMNRNMEPIKEGDMYNFSKEDHKDIGKIYVGGILVKNWDALGSGIEYGQGNVGRDRKVGNLISFDHGGSFEFRANGLHKDYGSSDISEKDSFLDSDISEGAHIFNNSLKRPYVKSHIRSIVRNLDMNKVKDLFKDSGLKNWETLHSHFVERHKKLLSSKF